MGVDILVEDRLQPVALHALDRGDRRAQDSQGNVLAKGGDHTLAGDAVEDACHRVPPDGEHGQDGEPGYRGSGYGHQASVWTRARAINTIRTWLGRSQYGGDPYFKGRMQDFRIYSGAQDAAFIANLAR